MQHEHALEADALRKVADVLIVLYSSALACAAAEQAGQQCSLDSDNKDLCVGVAARRPCSRQYRTQSYRSEALQGSDDISARLEGA